MYKLIKINKVRSLFLSNDNYLIDRAFFPTLSFKKSYNQLSYRTGLFYNMLYKIKGFMKWEFIKFNTQKGFINLIDVKGVLR